MSVNFLPDFVTNHGLVTPPDSPLVGGDLISAVSAVSTKNFMLILREAPTDLFAPDSLSLIHIFVDALAAVGVIALLTVVTVLGVQMFDDLAAFSGGDGAVTLPLDALFNGIQANPAAPEFWWVYAMLLSTMIPSLVNLTIAGGSLLRGVPWITALLLRNMPETSAPPVFERLWITLLLTAQLFIGGLLGIAAQGFLAYVVIGLVLPLFGLDLLDLARFVAAPDLPGALMRLVGTVRH